MPGRLAGTEHSPVGVSAESPTRPGLQAIGRDRHRTEC